MATGTSSRVPQPAFHVDDSEQSTYRTLSVAAVIGLILGLASPLCFGAPLLYIVPLAGIIVSVVALVRIAANSSVLTGRWAATAGLILSVAFAVAPVSREFVIRTVRVGQAKEFAQDWLTLITTGKSQEAFRLTVDSTRGPAPPSPDPSAKPTAPVDPYDAFVSTPIVKAIVAAGADADIRMTGTEAYDPQSFHHVYIRQRFLITPHAPKPDAPPVDVFLTTQRGKLPTEGRARWLMWKIDDAAKPAAPATPQ